MPHRAHAGCPRVCPMRHVGNAYPVKNERRSYDTWALQPFVGTTSNSVYNVYKRHANVAGCHVHAYAPGMIERIHR